MVDRGENWRNVVITCLVCKQKFGVGVCDGNPIYGGITCPWCGNSTDNIRRKEMPDGRVRSMPLHMIRFLDVEDK